MIAIANHLNDETVERFLLGTLSEADREQIEVLLSECSDCEQRAANAWPFDRLLDSWMPSETPAAAETSTAVLPASLKNHSRYRVVRKLGEGGMGSVWLAEHLVLRCDVAVKILRPDRLAHSGSAQRFLREMQAVARLRHPNIAAALDAEQIGDTYFLVMEYVEGATLFERVARGPLSVVDACRAIRDAARGLAHAHDAGLIHRDIKPSNLIQSSSGAVKILDFGLVAGGMEMGSITADYHVMGTPDYVAPEQAENARDADARSDIYSLGCTLYHLLSGRVPFPESSILKKLDGHRHHSPKPLADVRPRVAAIVAKMMAKKQDDRFQSAAQIADALEPFCVERPAPSAPPRSPWRIRVAAGFLAMFVLAGTAVYRIQTDRGELVITTETDDVEVIIKQGGKEVTLIDTKSKSGNVITLRSGVYDLELKGTPPGLSLDLERATLKRGQQIIAKIERVGVVPPAGRRSNPDQKPSAKLEPSKLTPGAVAVIKEHAVFAGHTKNVRAVAFSADAKSIFSASDDGDVIRWDRESGQLRQRFTHDSKDPLIFSLAFADNGKTLITSTPQRPYAWDIESGKRLAWFDNLALENGLNCISTSPNGRRLAMSFLSGRVQIRDLPTGRLENDFPPNFDHYAYQVIWLRDDVRVAYGTSNETVVIQDTADNRTGTFRLHDAGVISLAASPDGKSIAYVNFNGNIVAFDVKSKKQTASFASLNPDEALKAARICYALNGWILTAGRRHSIDLWDVNQGVRLAEFVGGNSQLISLAISSDGRWLAAGGENGDPSVRLWRMPE